MFKLHDSFKIAPTLGLSADRGVVRVVGIVAFEGIPAFVDTDAYLQGMDEDEVDQLTMQDWIAFKYDDKAMHEDYGVMYLPEGYLEELEDAAKKGRG